MSDRDMDFINEVSEIEESNTNYDLTSNQSENYTSVMQEEDMVKLNNIENILDIEEEDYPRFVLSKNKARFGKKLMWYKEKKDWLDIAPVSEMRSFSKKEDKKLNEIRSDKIKYEMRIETATLTPSQRSYIKDELKMCRACEKMAIQVVAKAQIKSKS